MSKRIAGIVGIALFASVGMMGCEAKLPPGTMERIDNAERTANAAMAKADAAMKKAQEAADAADAARARADAMFQKSLHK